MKRDDPDAIRDGILGDIRPKPDAGMPGDSVACDRDLEDHESMAGGSQHDRTEHSGTRDVTEGTTGSDIGNRPE
jgi:hypothetical protein